MTVYDVLEYLASSMTHEETLGTFLTSSKKTSSLARLCHRQGA